MMNECLWLVPNQFDAIGQWLCNGNLKHYNYTREMNCFRTIWSNLLMMVLVHLTENHHHRQFHLLKFVKLTHLRMWNEIFVLSRIKYIFWGAVVRGDRYKEKNEVKKNTAMISIWQHLLDECLLFALVSNLTIIKIANNEKAKTPAAIALTSARQLVQSHFFSSSSRCSLVAGNSRIIKLKNIKLASANKKLNRNVRK